MAGAAAPASFSRAPLPAERERTVWDDDIKPAFLTKVMVCAALPGYSDTKSR